MVKLYQNSSSEAKERNVVTPLPHPLTPSEFLGKGHLYVGITLLSPRAQSNLFPKACSTWAIRAEVKPKF